MNATKAAEPSDEPRLENTTLDHRYGKIGISAVAAAVCHKGEPRPVAERRFIQRESD